MECTVKKVSVTTLILTEAETKWLKHQMSKSIWSPGKAETAEDAKYRQLFWNAVRHG